MNNQAAQTMPERPELSVDEALRIADQNAEAYDKVASASRTLAAEVRRLAALSQTAGVPKGWRKVVMAELTRWMCDRDAEMAYARLTEAFAAAPAASGREDSSGYFIDGKPVSKDYHDGVLDGASRAAAIAQGQPPSAASVSERARVTQAMLDAGTSAMIEFRKSGGDWTDKPAHAAEVAIRAALEQALTQQRGEVLDRPARVGDRDFKAGELVQRVVGRAHAEYDRHHGGCLRHPYTGELRDYRDVESDPDGTLCVGPGPLAATTPQPSADAVRELVQRWRDQDARKHSAPGDRSDCADELESLLGRGG